MKCDRFTLIGIRYLSYHEVGHQVMAETFGCNTQVSIWHNDSAGMDWAGLCEYHSDNIPDDRVQRIEQLIGVAGMVAEGMHAYGNSSPFDEIYNHVCHTINTGNASVKDLQGMGISIWDDLDSVLVIDATKILREQWEDVERNANALFAATCRIFKLTNKGTELWNTH